MPTWMTTLFNAGIGFQGRPLRQITIPGTHDAGCYVNHTGWGGNYLSRTQLQDIGQQLTGGIRYFDLRPYHTNNQFWTYHGPFYVGGRMDAALGIIDQVRAFMAGLGGGDRELVILNISHFSKMGDATHRALINQIGTALFPHLVPHTQATINLFDAPYTTLLTHPITGVVASRVAVLYDGALDTGQEAYINAGPALPVGFFRVAPKYPVAGFYPVANQIQLFDQYANSDNLLTMQNDQLAKLRTRNLYNIQVPWGGAAWSANAVGGVAGTLHLFSWTLTPQPWTDPITAAANTSNPALLNVFSNNVAGWLGGGGNYDPAADPQINILYVDHYASNAHANALSPMNGWALPVAIAAQLNRGPIWPVNW